MRVIIETSKSFDRETKRFAKHYPSFLNDLKALRDALNENPFLGTDLGGGVRKIRMKITSKAKGKSAGARVISVNVYVAIDETKVNLLYIYDKTERSTITKREIDLLLKANGLKQQDRQ